MANYQVFLITIFAKLKQTCYLFLWVNKHLLMHFTKTYALHTLRHMFFTTVLVLKTPSTPTNKTYKCHVPRNCCPVCRRATLSTARHLTSSSTCLDRNTRRRWPWRKHNRVGPHWTVMECLTLPCTKHIYALTTLGGSVWVVHYIFIDF